MKTKQFKLNLPLDVNQWLDEQARVNLRSKSAEIILALRQKMEAENEASENK